MTDPILYVFLGALIALLGATVTRAWRDHASWPLSERQLRRRYARLRRPR